MSSKYKISYYLPDEILTNEILEVEFTDWTAQEIFLKTGIQQRHISAKNELASDLAIAAIKNLFSEYQISPFNVDFLIMVTQSPDYILPNTACLVQDRVGLPKTAGAIDINLGCSGFVYALSIAQALLHGGICENIIIVTADTYSKHIHPKDKSVRTLFGDGASATYLNNESLPLMNKFTFGTDGSGFNKFIVPCSGIHSIGYENQNAERKDARGYIRTDQNIYMNGHEIFMFVNRVIAKEIWRALEKFSLSMEDIDLIIFHQASVPILDKLLNQLNLNYDKTFCNIEKVGNTVSSSIPMALKDAEVAGKLYEGDTVMMVGFGVGLSWGIGIVKW